MGAHSGLQPYKVVGFVCTISDKFVQLDALTLVINSHQ